MLGKPYQKIGLSDIIASGIYSQSFFRKIQPMTRLERLLSFLENDPENLAIYRDAIITALESDDMEHCRILLSHIAANGIQDSYILAHAAHLALRTNDIPMAVKFGEVAIADGIVDPSVMFNAAFAHFHYGNHARANDLITLNDGTKWPSDAALLKARCLHYLELHEEAEKLLLDTIQAHKGNADALGILALISHEIGKNDAAFKYADLALGINESQHEALLTFAELHIEQEDEEKAKHFLENTLRHHPESGRAWLGLGQLDFVKLDLDTAETHLKKAAELMPSHIGTWHMLAWTYILKDQPALARDMLNRSYEIDRSFADTHGALAVVDVMEGHDEQASIRIKKALRLSPDAMAARYAELLLLRKKGDDNGARALIERAMQNPPPGGLTPLIQLVERRLKALQQQ